MKLRGLGITLFVLNLLMLVVGLRIQDDFIVIVAAVGAGALAPIIIRELMDMSK